MKTIYKNAKIFTSDETCPYAEAMLVEDGTITAIGSLSGCMEKVSADDKGVSTIDLGGKRVLPGFIDSHMHGLMLAEYSDQIAALPPLVNSIEDLTEAVRAEAAKKSVDEWIRGWGYDEGKLAEHRRPDRYDLDKGAPDHPVCILRSCIHIASVNSKALEMAGITKDTPDPEGGHIVRDDNGEPTGELQENARFLVTDLIPEQSEETIVAQLLRLSRLLLSQGIVAMTELGWFDGGDPLAVYRKAEAAGFKQDVAVYQLYENMMEMETLPFGPADLKPAKVRVAGVKLLSDGSMSGQTSWVYEPYLGTDNCGICEVPMETLESAIGFCKENHCQLAIHAMGGRAIDYCIDRIAEEEPWDTVTGIPHARMEHITEPTESAIEKAIARSIPFVTQPIFQHSEIETYLANLGAERTKRAYPVKTMLEKGVRMVLSTDSPATAWAVPSDPRPNLKHAVTRVAYDGTDCGKDQAIDIETALRLYTKEAAEVCGFDRLGQLKAGSRASFIVLDRDILAVPPEEITDIRIEKTYIDGVKCFDIDEDND